MFDGSIEAPSIFLTLSELTLFERQTSYRHEIWASRHGRTKLVTWLATLSQIDSQPCADYGDRCQREGEQEVPRDVQDGIASQQPVLQREKRLGQRVLEKAPQVSPDELAGERHLAVLFGRLRRQQNFQIQHDDEVS